VASRRSGFCSPAHSWCIVCGGQHTYKTTFTMPCERHIGSAVVADTTAKILPDTSVRVVRLFARLIAVFVIHFTGTKYRMPMRSMPASFSRASGFGLSAFWFSMVVHVFFPGDTRITMITMVHVTAGIAAAVTARRRLRPFKLGYKAHSRKHRLSNSHFHPLIVSSP